MAFFSSKVKLFVAGRKLVFQTLQNKIQEIVGGRKDYKIDCLAADFKDWEISW